MKTLSDAEHQSDPSHRLLPPLCGPSPEPPDPFDEHRDEKATTRRMAWTTTRVKSLSDQGRKAHTADEARPEHEARTRRMQPPKEGSAPDRPWTGRGRPSPSPTPSPDQQHPTEQNRNTWRTTLAPDLLQRETETEKIAVVPDDARSHHARALTGLHQPGQLLERITPVFLPPYAPDHNPVEHVRNTAKNNTATIQHETPEETLGASASHITGRTVDHDSEHPPPRNQKRSCSMTTIEPNHYSSHLLSQSAPSWTCEQRTTTTTTKPLATLAPTRRIRVKEKHLSFLTRHPTEHPCQGGETVS